MRFRVTLTLHRRPRGACQLYDCPYNTTIACAFHSFYNAHLHIRTMTDQVQRQRLAAFEARALEGPHKDNFLQALVILTASLIDPSSGIMCTQACAPGFFRPEYPFAAQRVIILRVVASAALRETSSQNYNFNREVWMAFLAPLTEDHVEVTAFHHGTTSAENIRPALQQIGSQADCEEIYAVQHSLLPVLCSTELLKFRRSTFLSFEFLERMSIRVAELRNLSQNSGDHDSLMLIVLSEDMELKSFLRDWAQSMLGWRVSQVAKDALWVTRDPAGGLICLSSMLLRSYHVHGAFAKTLPDPDSVLDLPVDLSENGHTLLLEAVASYTGAFNLKPVLRKLLPPDLYRAVNALQYRSEAWFKYYESLLERFGTNNEGGFRPEETQAANAGLFSWAWACSGRRRRHFPRLARGNASLK